MPLFLLRIQWWMEGATCSYGSMASFPSRNYGQLRGIDQEYPKHMVLWQGLFFDPLWSLFFWVWNVLKPWGKNSTTSTMPCFFIGLCPKSGNPNCGILGILVVSMVFPRFSDQAIHPGQASDQLTEVAQLPGGLQALWWKRRSKTECSRDVGLRFLVEYMEYMECEHSVIWCHIHRIE